MNLKKILTYAGLALIIPVWFALIAWKKGEDIFSWFIVGLLVDVFFAWLLYVFGPNKEDKDEK